MAIPGTTQVATDNFDRANENPITGNWTDSGSAQVMLITSNTAQPSSFSGSDSDAIWNVWASGDNQYSQAEITAVGSAANAGLGVTVRHSPTATTKTMYRLVIAANGAWELAKFLVGSKTSLDSGTATFVSGAPLGLYVTGSSISCWYNGAQIGTTKTDTGISTGVPGISYSSVITSGTIDNWDAGIPTPVSGYTFHYAASPMSF